MNRSDRIKAGLALVATVLFWGLSFTVTKVALAGLSPASVAFLRFGLAALVLAWPAARAGAFALGRADHVRVFAVSVVFPGCYFALETSALRLTSATNAALIAAAAPMGVLALSSFLARRWPTPGQVAGVGASLVGVGMLVGFSAAPANAGDALMLGAMACAAVYMVAASRLAGVNPLVLTGLQMLWGAVFFAPAFVAERPDLGAVAGASLAAVAALALFATVGAFLAYNFALSKVSATVASLCINAVPVVGVLGANLALGETITILQALGGAVVLACVFATSPRSGAGRERAVRTGESGA